MEIKDFYVDEPVVVGMFIGEIGWFLQRYQSYFRYLKQEVYKDHKMLLMMNPHLHTFVDDFVSWSVDLPQWFKDLNLEQDCYEAVLPNSPPGSLTPPDIYSNLIKYLKSLYNNEKGILILPPRGCNYWIDDQNHIFAKYTYKKELIKADRPIISVMPRCRDRASNRNVPEFVWADAVSKLSREFVVVLLGTPQGSCLSSVEGANIINLINYNKPDKTEQTIRFLNSSICSISSQSGGTHISLLSGCPSYIIGHERERHAVKENRLHVPVTFRYVVDYRCIDGETIYKDVVGFLKQLQETTYYHVTNLRPSMAAYLQNKKNLVGVEIGTYAGENALNILQSLDVKKLYLIDSYDYTRNVAGSMMAKEQVEKVKETAKDRLKSFNAVEWIYKKSEDAINDIKEQVDFVYVDGDHRYEAVKKDIELYYPKLKDNGLMSFHDFDAPDENNGVIQAVEEYFKTNNIQIFSSICKDDPKTHEGWIIKPTPFSNIINNDINILRDLINAR